MLTRQKLWVPVLEHNPEFVAYFHRFVHNNPLTSRNIAALNLQPENMYVALQPDARRPGAFIAAKLAVRLTIPRAVCDLDFFQDHPPPPQAPDEHHTTLPFKHKIHRNNFEKEEKQNDNDDGEMSAGVVTALADSLNSFHVMERLLPDFLPHVSVHLRTQRWAELPPLSPGLALVVVSSARCTAATNGEEHEKKTEEEGSRGNANHRGKGNDDIIIKNNNREEEEEEGIKKKKRNNNKKKEQKGPWLFHCETDGYLEPLSVPAAVAAVERRLTSVAGLEAVLRLHYRRAFHCSHVKCVLAGNQRQEREEEK